MNNLLVSDGYKQSHRPQYPKGTELVYSNWTPRSGKYAPKGSQLPGVVVFGVQSFIKEYLIEDFNKNFFNKPFEEVEKSFKRRLTHYLGSEPEVNHVKDLHDLGYLPIVIKALPEGSICPFGVPALTIYNTNPKFFWVTNFLETVMSTELWLPMTSATIGKEYRLIGEKWADKTCDNRDHLPFQFHDFSMRGMSNRFAAATSGAGFLLSSSGTDTIPAVDYLEKYYNADCEKELIGCSIPATEHSVMCMGTKDDELGTFKRLITEIYPNGLVSIVSDTWDLWKVCTEYLPTLKEEILARDGKVVIRPDSGNPADIICGFTLKIDTDDLKTIKTHPERFGVIELLWETFGGTINEKGYKVLDPRIGVIYGDSITLAIADEICARLEAKGFASSNIVFGVGSYTFQMKTRDTYGFAMKATYGEVNGEAREIFKDPITDDGLKKSAKGLLCVDNNKSLSNGVYYLVDQVDWEEEKLGNLEEVFKDGKIVKETSLSEIRERLNK